MDHEVFIPLFVLVDFDEMVTTPKSSEAGKFIIKVNRSVELV